LCRTENWFSPKALPRHPDLNQVLAVSHAALQQGILRNNRGSQRNAGGPSAHYQLLQADQPQPGQYEQNPCLASLEPQS